MRELISRRLNLNDPSEPRKSRLLFSVLVIGAALALVGGATFAVFTDSQVASGTVNAGTIILCITEASSDDQGCDEGIFELDAENLLPGQFVEETLRLVNTGNGPWDLTFTEGYAGTGVNCDPSGPFEFYTTLTWTDLDNDNHLGVVHVEPGRDEQVVVRVGVHADAPNTCQNTQYTVTLTFTATQDAPPPG